MIRLFHHTLKYFYDNHNVLRARQLTSTRTTEHSSAGGGRMILASVMKTISLTQLLSSCMDASRQGCEVSRRPRRYYYYFLISFYTW